MALLVNSGHCQNCPCRDNDCNTDQVISRVGVNRWHPENQHIFWLNLQASPAPNTCEPFHIKDVYLFYDSPNTWIGESWTFVKFNNVQAGDTITVNGLTFTAHATTTTVSLREFRIAGTDSNDMDALNTCLNNATYGVPHQTATRAFRGAYGDFIFIKQWPGYSITVSTSAPSRIVIYPLVTVQMILSNDYYQAVRGASGEPALLVADNAPAFVKTQEPGVYRIIESLTLTSGTDDIITFFYNYHTSSFERDLELCTVNCCVSMQFLYTMVARRVVVDTDAVVWNATTSGSAGAGTCTSLDGTVNSGTGSGTSVSGASSTWFFTGNWGPSVGGSTLNALCLLNDWNYTNEALLAWSTITVLPATPATTEDKYDHRLFYHHKSHTSAGLIVYQTWIIHASSADVRDPITAGEFIEINENWEELTLTVNNVIVNDTVTINGLTYTAKAATNVSAREFQTFGTVTPTLTAQQLVICLQDATYGTLPAGVKCDGNSANAIALRTHDVTRSAAYYMVSSGSLTVTIPASMQKKTTGQACPTDGTVTAFSET